METGEIKDTIENLGLLLDFVPLTDHAWTIVANTKELLTDLLDELDVPAVPQVRSYERALNNAGFQVGQIIRASERPGLPERTRVQDVTTPNGGLGVVEDRCIKWDVAPWNPIPLSHGYANLRILAEED